MNPVSQVAPLPFRFHALDAWRGLCACFVALFHMQAYSHIYDFTPLRRGFLFVDFFFVLSGFVITANYRARLLSGFSPWEFMWLRFGRLYPLHFAILLAFVALELAKHRLDGLLGGQLGDAFSETHSIGAIITNALLVHSLGFHNVMTWNHPSWSISTEFYAYAVFAVVLLILRSYIYIWIIFVLVFAPVFLLMLVGHIDTTYNFGMIRCILGFFIGFVCYDLYVSAQRKVKFDSFGFLLTTLVELSCVGLLILFLYLCGTGPHTLAAPWIFGITVLVFSFERGAVSKALKVKPFIFLGAISYSIYMVHILVQIGIRYALQLGERNLGLRPFSNDGRIGLDMWQGDIAYGVMLLLVVGISFLTYKLIEEPGRRHSRKMADRLFADERKLQRSRRFACV
jgi:peptidoglycan/LPS O-acetylase OafA/YrhL